MTKLGSNSRQPQARRSLEVGALTEFDKGPTAPPLDELPPPYERIAGEQSMPLQSTTTRW